MSLMDDLLSSADWSPTNFLGASLTLGADQTYNTDKTSMTQPSTAIDVMQPVNTSAGLGEWGGFLKDTLQAFVGYSIAKDAQQSGVKTPAQQQQQAQAQQLYAQGQTQQLQAGSLGGFNLGGGLLPLLLIGGLLVFALKD